MFAGKVDMKKYCIKTSQACICLQSEKFSMVLISEDGAQVISFLDDIKFFGMFRFPYKWYIFSWWALPNYHQDMPIWESFCLTSWPFQWNTWGIWHLFVVPFFNCLSFSVSVSCKNSVRWLSWLFPLGCSLHIAIPGQKPRLSKTNKLVLQCISCYSQPNGILINLNLWNGLLNMLRNGLASSSSIW